MRCESSSERGPVFVIGCPRSGTSALAWALAQHPGFWTSAESDFLLELFGRGRLRQVYDRAFGRADNGWLKVNDVGYEEFARHLGAGVSALFESRSRGRRWVDSTPGYTQMAQTLAGLLPNARFLNVVRDGRAVVCSMSSCGFPVPWASDFPLACRTWAYYARMGCSFQAERSDLCLEVSHSSIVEDPEPVMAEVTAFLGEAPDPRCSRFLSDVRINSSYDNEKPEDIRRPKSTASLRRRPWESWSDAQWQAFEQEAGEVFADLAPGFGWE